MLLVLLESENATMMAIEEFEPLSSDQENSNKKITLERVLLQCGAFSYFQIIHGFFLLLICVASGLVNFYFVFAAAEPNHQCLVTNETGFNFQVDSSQCSFKKLDSANQTVDVYPCTQWTYGEHIFGKTFSEEANMVCQSSIQRSLLSTALQFGAMFIFFTGQITDLMGRRRSMQLLVALWLITWLVTQTFIQFIPMQIKYKFFLMIINQFISGIDGFMISLLIMIETTTSSYVTLVGNLALIAYALGEIVIVGMAYVSRHWLVLKWVMSFYMVALLPYLYFMPESPQWLLSKHRYADLEKQLSQIARLNRQSTSKWMPYYRYVVEKHQSEKTDKMINKVKLSFLAKTRRFFTHVPTMSKLIISGILGFATCLLYFRLAFSLGSMNEIDPYVNLIIGAIVEIISYLVASLFLIRYGRRPVLVLFLLLTAGCLVSMPYLSQSGHFISVLLAQSGKFAISGALCVTYIYVPELFPTTIRGTGMGFFILLSRTGSSLAPMIDATISHNPVLLNRMYYIYTGLSLFSIVLTLLLPETWNVPLEHKIDYDTKKVSSKARVPAHTTSTNGI